MIPPSNVIVAWVMAAIGATAGWWFTATYYQGALAQEHYQQARFSAEQSKMVLVQVQQNEQLKHDLGVQSEKNRSSNARLRDAIAGISMRIPADLCADYRTTDPATGGQPAVAGAGVLPATPASALGEVQDALGEYIAGDKIDAEMMDAVVEQCRPVVVWARSFNNEGDL